MCSINTLLQAGAAIQDITMHDMTYASTSVHDKNKEV